MVHIRGLEYSQNWTSQDVRSSQISISLRTRVVHAAPLFWKQLFKKISSLWRSVWADRVSKIELSVQMSSLRKPPESHHFSRKTCRIRSVLSEDLPNQIPSVRRPAESDQFSLRRLAESDQLFWKELFEQISSYYRFCWTVHQFRAHIWSRVPLLDTLW